VHAINLACDELVGLLEPAASTLRIGFTGASQNRELLEFTRAFRRDHPDVRLDFRKDTFDGCRRQLLDGSVDCCFGIENTYRDLESVQRERLFDYEICVVCSLDSPLAQRPYVTPADIRGEGFVIFKPEYGRLFYRDFMDLLRDDCAVAAAHAAMSDWTDRVIDVNGPELLTIGEYLAIASEVTGKKVTYEYIDDDALYAFFDSIGVPRTTEGMWADSAQNFPFCSDGMVSFGRAIRLGQMSTFTNDFEELVGRKPITVREIFEHMDEHLIGARTSTEG